MAILEADGSWVMIDNSAQAELACYTWRMHANSMGVKYPARWDKRTHRWIYLHIEAWSIAHNRSDPRPLQVDHIDGNTQNCYSVNLRAGTRSQNSANRKRAAKYEHKLRGVSITPAGRYMARIRAHNKTVTLGTFDTEDQAARAYDAAAVVAFGEFARPNFKDKHG